MMGEFKFVFSIILYTVALHSFGVYIYLIEYLEISAGFLLSGLYKLDAEYDYIIVGCGSAGSTAALRLSENKNVSVLVLEAGPRGTSWFDIPAVGILFQLSSIDWQYRTVSQTNSAKAFKNHASNWPRGRAVGGTGRLNNMLYVRGHPSDFKDWVKQSEGYDYDYDILQYFKKSENYQGAYKDLVPRTAGTNSIILNGTFSRDESYASLFEYDYITMIKLFGKYHSSGGYLIVNDQKQETPLTSAFLDAVKILGYPIRDINGRYNTGFMKPQVNIKSGGRWLPAHQLMSESRPNLILQANTHVDKVLLKSDFEAYGVTYRYLGREFKVRARKGVILSAGVIGTPKILMLSGIGPKKHLDDLGIRSKVNLPVGHNLRDHVTTGADLVLLNTSLGISPPTMMSLFTAYDYFIRSSGLWTGVGCEAIGLIHTNAALTDSEQPDLQLMVLPIGASSDGGRHLVKVSGFTDLIWEEYFKHYVRENAISILPVVLHPKSTGTIRLKDSNPMSHPIINPNYLSDPYDIEILLKGIDLIKKIIKTSPMQRLGAKLNTRKFPGCENLDFDTPSYWECYVKHVTITSYHPIGTCKMGEIAEDAVVGYDFRVHGTNKLFVADASVIPSTLSGNPNAAAVMIGEKVIANIMNYNFLNENSCTILEVFVTKRFC